MNYDAVEDVLFLRHHTYNKAKMGDDLDVDAMLEAPFKKSGTESPVRNNRENGFLKGNHKSNDNDNEETENHYDHNKSSKRDCSRDRDKNDRDKRGDRDRNKNDRDIDKNDRDKRDQGRDKRRRSSSKSRDKRRSSRDRQRRSPSFSHNRRRNYSSHSRDRRRRSPSHSRDKRRVSPPIRDRRDRRMPQGSYKDTRRRTRSPSRDRRRRRTKSRSKERMRSKSKTKTPKRELTTEERDARTVFCMQLSSRIRARDLDDFFSVVGKITDVRIITDAKTRRSRGIAYVEFEDIESVTLAMGLSDQKILGIPIIVQPTLAEKNRLANAGIMNVGGISGPTRLYVGSLHFNITEQMIRSIFEPFGKIDHIQLILDTETGRSKGYGFITFHVAEDSKKALEQLNGFELAGRPMKVNHVTERLEMEHGSSFLDSDYMERAGIDLGATGRLQLMAKLAEGTGLELPAAATNALNMPIHVQHQPAPTIATQCFLLSNMFDPLAESNPNWDRDIREDVLDECNKHGGALHMFVDRQSTQGNVYVKCPTIATAVAAVNSLHGRFFAGKMITAAYVPVISYHTLLPDSLSSTKLLSIETMR